MKSEESFSLRKKRSLEPSVLMEGIQEKKILNRKTKLYKFLMNSRTQNKSITIETVENAKNIDEKIKYLFQFFSSNDICNLYKSQIDYIKEIITIEFTEILLDEKRVYNSIIKENVLKILSILLVENSTFLDLFLEIDIIQKFSSSLIKTINEETSEKNTDLIYLYLIIISNIFCNDEICIKIVTNNINLNVVLLSIANNYIYQSNSKIEGKVELTKIILILIRNLLFNIENNEQSQFVPLIDLTNQFLVQSYEAKSNLLLYEALETLSIITESELNLKEDLYTIMYNIISDSSFNDEIMTNALQICCNIIDAIEHSYGNSNSNIEIIYNVNTIKYLKRLLGTFLLFNSNCSKEDFSIKKDLFIYSVRFLGKIINFTKLSNIEIDNSILSLFQTEKTRNLGLMLNSIFDFAQFEQCFEINREILHLYILIFESKFFQIKNILIDEIKLHKYYAMKIKDIDNNNVIFDILELIETALSYYEKRQQTNDVKEDLIYCGFVELIENMQINHINEAIRSKSEEIVSQFFVKDIIDDFDFANYMNVR